MNEFLAALLAEPAAESEETYVLSRFSNASVKVRDGLMDTKALRRVTGMGLELWEPTMKVRFPLDGAALATMFEALGLPPSQAPDGGISEDVLLEEILAPQDELRAVSVRKSRHRCRLDDCILEITDLVVDGSATIRTVAAKAADPELVTATPVRLGLVSVGIAGLCQAPNRDDFVAEVFARSGVAVEVISGRDEARLAYLAATSDLRTTGNALLVFDSGGGSSQFRGGHPDGSTNNSPSTSVPCGSPSGSGSRRPFHATPSREPWPRSPPISRPFRGDHARTR